MSATRCAPFWAESPRILFDDAYDFYPFSERSRICTSTALNSLTRFGIYLAVILSVLYRSGAYLGIAVGIGALAVAAYYGMKDKNALREGFADGPAAIPTTIVTPTLIRTENGSPNLIGGNEVADRPVADVIGTADRTLPTGPNPFMNLLINEIKSNPTKPPAINTDTPEMARVLSNEFQGRMYGDPTDVFQRNQNQRAWVTQPSTSIPNDQESFQNWLYRVPGRTCKEGNNYACRTGTEGGAVTWLSSP